jgi:hypothetical protein
MKAYLCKLCKTIWLNERPFLCDCHSNCFLVEMETTEDEISLIKSENKEIVIKEVE